MKRTNTCKHEGCKNTFLRQGYCAEHYNYLNHNISATCSVEECESPTYCKGYCVKHYSRARTHGDPMIVRKKAKNPNITDKYLAHYHNLRGKLINPKHPSYYSWGAKGFVMCEEWKQSVNNFYNDMGNQPEDSIIYLKEGEKVFNKDNCVWVNMNSSFHGDGRRKVSELGRKEIANSNMPIYELSMKYNISQSRIRSIRKEMKESESRA